MGVPLGHKLKIMKRIKDIRAERGMSVPQSRQGTSRREHTKADAISETAEKSGRAEMRGTETALSQESTQKSSLKDGQYDEGAAHGEFLEALNAWRSAGKGGPAPVNQSLQLKPSKGSPAKKVTFSEKQNEIKSL